MRSFGFSIILIFCFGQALAQYTLIPDNEFELRLIAQGIDTEGTLDGQVLTDDIDHITFLSVTTPFPETDPLINDLTGIEDFVSLEDLRFASNNVTTVDLSNNLNLRSLNCKLNNLTTLDLSNNILLETLDAANCFPGTCDMENTFTELDLSNNVNLISLFFTNSNTVSSLNLSSNPMLERVTASRNTILNSLNLKNGNNTNITLLNVIDNPMLDCITVDDPEAATEGVLPPYNNWDVEPGVIFSKDCTLGIDEVGFYNETFLSPNPAKSRVEIHLPNEATLELLELYDSLGRKILESKDGTAFLPVSGLETGVYWVRVHTDMGTLTKRLVKE